MDPYEPPDLPDPDQEPEDTPEKPKGGDDDLTPEEGKNLYGGRGEDWKLDRDIIGLLEKFPSITQKDIAKRLNRSNATIHRHMVRIANRSTVRVKAAVGEIKASETKSLRVQPSRDTSLGATERAKDLAVREVDKLTAEAVADEAVQYRGWDIETGAWMRELWRDNAMRSEFPSPVVMVKEAFDWWWNYRDRINFDSTIIESQRQTIEMLEAAVDPRIRRSHAFDLVLQAALAAALIGNPLTEETIKSLYALALAQGEA